MLLLTEVDPITTSKYQQVRNQLDSTEINLTKTAVADRPGQGKEENDDTSNTMQGKVSAQDTSSPDERQDRQHTGSVSTVTWAVDVEVGTLADQIAQVNVGMVKAQVTPSGQGLSRCHAASLLKASPPFESPT